MSEDALNAAIAAKWESAGLHIENEGADIVSEPDVAEVTEGDTDVDTAVVDDPAAVPDPNAADPVEPDTTEEADPDPTTVVDEPEAVEKKTPAEQATQDAHDELAEKLGLGKPPEDPKKRAAWWKQRVPYSQVNKVVAEMKKGLEDAHTGVIKGHTDKISDYDKRWIDVKTVEDIIKDKPEQYLNTLATLFPDTYGKMFAPILGKGDAIAAELLVDTTDPGPKPAPDLDLPNNGGKTYSVEGHQKLMDWEQKVIEQNMLKRFKPHLDFIESQKKVAEQKQKADLVEHNKQKGLQIANDAIAEVQTWEFGKDNIKAIVDEAAKLPAEMDARLALSIAYNKVVSAVVIPKLKADRDAMTAEITKNMKAASAKQTAAGLQTQTKKAAPPAVTDLDTRLKAIWKREGLI